MFLFFQSTLLQEERLKIISHVFPIPTFNPRSYKRSDHIMHLFVDNNMLSIHAPTRGATTWSLCIFWVITFNPRSYKRSDIYVGTESASFSSFNPRSYKRSDIERLVYHLYHITFNPRSYKRSDNLSQTRTPNITLSIHAPTRGATQFVQ